MKRLFLVLSCVVLSGSTLCSAAVFERDWKTPGDGLLTYDDVNRREWLDLSQTLLSDQFPGSGLSLKDIRESRYQYVVSQTEQGGLFWGFTVAKSADVIALAQSAGIDTSTLEYSTNIASTKALATLLCMTVYGNNGNMLSIGLIDEIRENFYPQLTTRLDADLFVGLGTPWPAGLRIAANQLEFSDPPGVMLYRGIPEPTAVLLLVSGLACWCLIGFPACLSQASASAFCLGAYPTTSKTPPPTPPRSTGEGDLG